MAMGVGPGLSGWLQAGLFGLLSGGALVIGAAFGYTVRVPPPVIAAVMAFGAGVLISALAFDLVEEAYERAGVLPTVIGFLAGTVVYLVANLALARQGARHRKRSGDQQPTEAEAEGSGLAIAVGALLDGIPESIAIGLSLLGGGGAGAATVAAVFVSNLPEGLSSAAGMRQAKRGPGYVFGVWGGIAVLSAVAAVLGYTVFGGLSEAAAAATTAVAAGAILAMLADTMLPEAFEQAGVWTGLIVSVGFLLASGLSRLGG